MEIRRIYWLGESLSSIYDAIFSIFIKIPWKGYKIFFKKSSSHNAFYNVFLFTKFIEYFIVQSPLTDSIFTQVKWSYCQHLTMASFHYESKIIFIPPFGWKMIIMIRFV